MSINFVDSTDMKNSSILYPRKQPHNYVKLRNYFKRQIITEKTELYEKEIASTL